MGAIPFAICMRNRERFIKTNKLTFLGNAMAGSIVTTLFVGCATHPAGTANQAEAPLPRLVPGQSPGIALGISPMEIENFAERDRIWFHPRIGLRYQTTPDQLRYILVAIRKLPYAHPKVLNDGARVRFTNFGDYSLDLDIFCHVAEADYGRYLGVAENLNLRIMDIVEEAGSGFAFPSQTTYFERDQGLDPARARQSAAEVEKWKAEQKLYLPDFPEDKIRELEGTIEYLPAGSPAGKPPGSH